MNITMNELSIKATPPFKLVYILKSDTLKQSVRERMPSSVAQQQRHDADAG